MKGGYIDLTEHNLKSANVSDRVIAFLRFQGDERLMVVVGFNSKLESIKIAIPKDVAARLGLNSDKAYVGRDLLGSGLDVGFDQDFTCSFDLLPFTGLIIKIK
jgi:hypothetical protein